MNTANRNKSIATQIRFYALDLIIVLLIIILSLLLQNLSLKALQAFSLETLQFVCEKLCRRINVIVNRGSFDVNG